MILQGLLLFALAATEATCSLPEEELVVIHRASIRALHQPAGQTEQELREANGGVIVIAVELDAGGAVISADASCTTVSERITNGFLSSVRNWKFEVPSIGALRGTTVIRLQVTNQPGVPQSEGYVLNRTVGGMLRSNQSISALGRLARR